MANPFAGTPQGSIWEEEQKRNNLRQMMLKQALAPSGGTEYAGRFAVPSGGMNALSKAVQAYFAGKGQQEAGEKAAQTAKDFQSGREGAIRQLTDAMTGTEAATLPPAYPGVKQDTVQSPEHMKDLHLSGVRPEVGSVGPTRPAQKPDLQKAAMMAATNPYLQGTGASNVTNALLANQMKNQAPTTVAPGSVRLSRGDQDFYNPSVKTGAGKDDVKKGISVGNGMVRDRYIIDGKLGPWAGPAYKEGGEATYYAKERLKLMAEDTNELKKSADSAFKSNLGLDRIAMHSEKASEGALQPVYTLIKGVGVSLGIDSESLTSDYVFSQAGAQILADYMKALGARGLTDKDMEILRDTLPRAESSHEARIEITKILKKANNRILDSYLDRVDEEAALMPGMKGKQFSSPWARGYIGNNGRAPRKIPQSLWNRAKPEQRQIFMKASEEELNKLIQDLY